MNVQHSQNGGKCGVCGDNYALPRPRPNENGGKYGTGTIVRTYEAGQKITTTVYIDANHLGYFEFSLCPLSGEGGRQQQQQQRQQLQETEECFERHPLLLADGSRRYRLQAGARGNLSIELRLPEGLSCEHCVFRWHWRTANNWGVCGGGGKAGMGCGPQEHYRSCSDIAIR